MHVNGSTRISRATSFAGVSCKHKPGRGTIMFHWLHCYGSLVYSSHASYCCMCHTFADFFSSRPCLLPSRKNAIRSYHRRRHHRLVQMDTTKPAFSMVILHSPLHILDCAPSLLSFSIVVFFSRGGMASDRPRQNPGMMILLHLICSD